MSQFSLEGILKMRDETGEATNAATKGMDSLNGAVNDTIDSLGVAGDAFRLASAAIVTFGVVEAGKAIANLAMLGAEVQRTERTFQNISGGAEQATENLEAMRVATRGAISDSEAMAQANRLLQMGLAGNADELANLTEMAVTLGTAMGRDATQSIEEFSLLLANQSIPRLDTFGISAARVRERIDDLMRANQRLTREEAFNQAVAEEGAKAMERLGEQVDDNALATEQAAASWSNFKDEVSEAYAQLVRLAAPFVSVIDYATDLIEKVNEMTEAFGWWETRLGAIAGFLGNAMGGQPSTALYDFDLQRQYGSMGGAQVDYRTGRAADRQAAISQHVTMYNPQFNNVRDPQNMLETFQNMGP